jgi:hypothetical protein
VNAFVTASEIFGFLFLFGAGLAIVGGGTWLFSVLRHWFFDQPTEQVGPEREQVR